ncbi:unnamed protein product, partial [Rhizoctonia solani]
GSGFPRLAASVVRLRQEPPRDRGYKHPEGLDLTPSARLDLLLSFCRLLPPSKILSLQPCGASRAVAPRYRLCWALPVACIPHFLVYLFATNAAIPSFTIAIPAWCAYPSTPLTEPILDKQLSAWRMRLKQQGSIRNALLPTIVFNSHTKRFHTRERVTVHRIYNLARGHTPQPV